MFLSEWLEFPSAPCLAVKETRWHLVSPCCWNRARPWQASEFVSFLVGLRTYQHSVVGIILRCNNHNLLLFNIYFSPNSVETLLYVSHVWKWTQIWGLMHWRRMISSRWFQRYMKWGYKLRVIAPINEQESSRVDYFKYPVVTTISVITSLTTTSGHSNLSKIYHPTCIMKLICLSLCRASN